MAFNEQINIYLTAIAKTQGFSQIKKSIADMQRAIPKATAPELTAGIGILQDRLKEIAPKIAEYSQKIKETAKSKKGSIGQFESHKKALEREKIAINQTLPAMQKQLKAIEKQPTKLEKLNTAFRRLTGPLLGVMFAGMALQRVTFGLLAPAATAVGLFDIWGNILTILFLPVMELLIPVFLWLLDTILNMSEDTKKAIGIFILLVGGLGIFLSVIGMVGLAIGGIIGLVVNITELFQNLFGEVGGGIISMGLFAVGGEGLTNMFQKLGDIAGPVIQGIIDKIFGLDQQKKLLEAFGITVEEGETPWIALKRTVSEKIDGILEKLGFSKTEIETWKTKIGEFIDDLKTDFGELKTKLGEFTTKWTNLATELDVKVLPTLIRLMDILNTILDTMTKITHFFKSSDAEIIHNAVESTSHTGTPLQPLAANLLKSWIPGTIAKAAGTIPETEIMMSKGFAEMYAAAKAAEGGGGGGAGDFIWRPGSAPVAFSPNDTIIGSKGGGAGGIVVNQTNSIQVADLNEFERLITRNNSKLVDDIKRLSGGVAI